MLCKTRNVSVEILFLRSLLRWRIRNVRRNVLDIQLNTVSAVYLYIPPTLTSDDQYTYNPRNIHIYQTEELTRNPGGGQKTYTIGSTTKSQRRAISATTNTETDKDTERETEANGILTAPDVDEGDSDPLASLSVNPTMVKTASNGPSTATGTDAPKSILTAPSGTAYPNEPDVVTSPSSTLATAVPTGSAKASASTSASVSASVSGGATPSASVVSGGASSLVSSSSSAGRGVVVGVVVGLVGLGGVF